MQTCKNFHLFYLSYNVCMSSNDYIGLAFNCYISPPRGLTQICQQSRRKGDPGVFKLSLKFIYVICLFDCLREFVYELDPCLRRNFFKTFYLRFWLQNCMLLLVAYWCMSLQRTLVHFDLQNVMYYEYKYMAK